MSHSNNQINKADSLKSLDNLYVADPRNDQLDIALWHAQLAEITLNANTPIDVKQLFENAKNIALYTYFAYRLHQSAETIAYIALEKAIKMKYKLEKDNISCKTPKYLADYMNIALEQGWIADQGYESSRYIAEDRVWTRNAYEIINSRTFEPGEIISVSDPTEEEVVAEMKSMEIAKGRLHAGRHIRNFLAHGDGGLAPSSYGTLINIAEEINQLFE